ncbi:MAG: hypothetical protein DI564_04800 [Rhodanobacter denitrificans]|uniref:Outer membrane protein beta-barrel domain-containing protein n=1 Tax=Rhodanobacter denitrificans TaxID=666685 RepID=A0A2W5KUW8_9GAMM|nr:MAG: hypothetical protein DI564_04800 [Rhodanobacter denitrificans]
MAFYCMPFPRSILALGLAAGLASIAAPAVAAPSQALDRVSIWLGGYRADADFDLTLREEQSGLDSGRLDVGDFKDTVGRARLDFLIMDSQGFSFDYYGLSRDRSLTLVEPFSFGGTDFDANAVLDTRLEFDVGNAAYRWWFGGDQTVFGFGLGAAWYRIDARVRGEATFDGQTFTATERYKDDAVAPLVQLGWRHAFSDNVRTYIDISGVKKNGGSLEGHIYNGSLGVEWFPWQNLGLGAEYSVSRIKLDGSEGSYDATADIKLHGPSAYLRLRF